METLGFVFGGNLKLLPLLVPVLILSLTIHEFAHARVALSFGDPTAQAAGRVTLNPMRHLDPLGTIMILVVGFGWAKPVPVNPYLLHPPKLGSIMVSVAGPASNLSLAIVCAITLKIMIHMNDSLTSSGLIPIIFTVLRITMVINVMLCIFNLIPLFPLDGHHILREMLDGEKQVKFMQWQYQYGIICLMLLILGPHLAEQALEKNLPGLSYVSSIIDSWMLRIFGII